MFKRAQNEEWCNVMKMFENFRNCNFGNTNLIFLLILRNSLNVAKLWFPNCCLIFCSQITIQHLEILSDISNKIPPNNQTSKHFSWNCQRLKMILFLSVYIYWQKKLNTILKLVTIKHICALFVQIIITAACINCKHGQAWGYFTIKTFILVY